MTAPVSVSAIPTCASCLFGAVSSSTITPAFHAVETIWVDVTPYVTIFNNGSTKTSWSNHTRTTTVFVNNATQSTELAAGPTFTDTDDITWTWGNTTLRYGTTYVQYLGFEAATGSSNDCADQSDATSLMLPSDTDEASFIYPYTASAGLPPELLDYLGSLPTVAAQLGSQDLELCALLTTAAPSPIYTTVSLKEKRFEGARRDIGAQQNGVARGNFTSPNNGTSPNSGTSPANGTGLSTVSLPLAGPPETTALTSTSGQTYKSVAPQPETQTSSALFSPAPFASSTPQNVHTTAYIISKVTARGFTYTEPVGTADSAVVDGTGSRTGANPGPTETRLPNSAGSQNPGQNTAPNVGSEAAASTGQDVGVLLGAIGAVVTQTQAGRPVTTQQAPQDIAAPVFNVGTTVVSANSEAEYMFGDQTLTPGQTVTIQDGISQLPVALQMQGGSTLLVVDGNTYAGSVGGSTPAPSAVITANGEAFGVAQSGESVVVYGSDQTAGLVLAPGSQTTLDGIAFSALSGSEGPGVVVSGTTFFPSEASGGTAFAAGEHTFTAVKTGDSILLADGASTITLPPGLTTTFDGNSISAGQSGTVIVVDGKTYTLSANAAMITQHTIRINGHTFTALDGDGSVVVQDGTLTVTLMDGEQTTFEGETISALSAGNGLVIDTSITTTFGPQSSNMGDYIAGGLSPEPTNTLSATAGTASPNNSGSMISLLPSVAWPFCSLLIVLITLL